MERMNLKYRIEIQEQEHKIVIENTNARLPELLNEFYRAIAKIFRTINPEFIEKTTIESIKKAYQETQQ